MTFLGTRGASCAEPSGARLRAADAVLIPSIRATRNEDSDGECELQSASLLSRSAKRCFVLIPLARFPFLLSQVSVFVVKPMEKHTFLAPTGVPKKVPKSRKAYKTIVKPSIITDMSLFPKENTTFPIEYIENTINQCETINSDRTVTIS